MTPGEAGASALTVLDWMAPPETRLLLQGDGVTLRPPRIADFEAWADVRSMSRAFLQPWEPTWPADDLTRGAFRRRLTAYARERETEEAWRFIVFREGDGQIVGGVSLSNVRRGVAQTGTIGYWAGQPHLRRGHTLSAVRAVARYAFDKLKLHRLEAACVPENHASASLLLKAGFQREGYARSYLKINGAWRDHLLFGRLSDDREGGPGQ